MTASRMKTKAYRYARDGKQNKLTGADLRVLLDDYNAAVQSFVKIENIVTEFDERNS